MEARRSTVAKRSDQERELCRPNDVRPDGDGSDSPAKGNPAFPSIWVILKENGFREKENLVPKRGVFHPFYWLL